MRQLPLFNIDTSTNSTSDDPKITDGSLGSFCSAVGTVAQVWDLQGGS